MQRTSRLKFVIGGVIIAVALGFLIFNATRSNTQFFMTVEELQAQKLELVNKKLRMSGAVIGETIKYDPKTLDLSFEVAQIPGDHREIEQMGGMAKVLADAVADPNAPRILIHYIGVRPDLLKDQSQAIVTGSLDEKGVFQASELLMKCPSRYESALPEQAGE